VVLEHVLVLGDLRMVVEGVAASLRAERVARRVEVHDGPAQREHMDTSAVVLADLGQPVDRPDGPLDAARGLQPWRAVLVVDVLEPAPALTAAASGVAGFVLSSSPPRALADAVERVAAGELVMPRSVLSVLRTANSAPPRPRLPAGRTDVLSRRERDVLDLLEAGLSRAEVAHLLGISPHTVRTHVQRAQHKLSRASAPS
jgi:DNA-binding NarL/FixJ family response regulator